MLFSGDFMISSAERQHLGASCCDVKHSGSPDRKRPKKIQSWTAQWFGPQWFLLLVGIYIYGGYTYIYIYTHIYIIWKYIRSSTRVYVHVCTMCTSNTELTSHLQGYRLIIPEAWQSMPRNTVVPLSDVCWLTKTPWILVRYIYHKP